MSTLWGNGTVDIWINCNERWKPKGTWKLKMRRKFPQSSSGARGLRLSSDFQYGVYRCLCFTRVSEYNWEYINPPTFTSEFIIARPPRLAAWRIVWKKFLQAGHTCQEDGVPVTGSGKPRGLHVLVGGTDRIFPIFLAVFFLNPDCGLAVSSYQDEDQIFNIKIEVGSIYVTLLGHISFQI